MEIFRVYFHGRDMDTNTYCGRETRNSRCLIGDKCLIIKQNKKNCKNNGPPGVQSEAVTMFLFMRDLYLRYTQTHPHSNPTDTCCQICLLFAEQQKVHGGGGVLKV